MSNFSEVLRLEPVRILSKEPSQALDLVKSYLDEVLALYKKSETEAKTGIDEIVTDGLDANQVWWQAKMIVENVGGDILEKIQDLKELENEHYEDNDSSVEENNPERDSFGLESSDDGSEQSPQEEKIEDTGEIKELNRDNGSVATDEGEDSNNNNSNDDYPAEKLGEDYEASEQPAKPPLEEETEDQESLGEADYSKAERANLNDGFFDLDEFNRQTLEIERSGTGEKDDENIDFFAELPSEDDEEALYYQDFFDQPKSQLSSVESNKRQPAKSEFTEDEYDAALDSAKLDLFADKDDDLHQYDENKESEQELSTFEKQQLDIKQQIRKLEEEAVAEKKWALKGEVQSKDRPQDALLEEDVEFDRTSKPVPVITKDITESLEDMIRRRIQDGGFDDLQRRAAVDTNLKTFKPDFQLSDQKSSKSLAELYEEDYKGVSQDIAISEELQKGHDEISQMFNNLFYKLDALSSAHFIPKPAQKSLEVRVEAPAVSMEDAQPLTLSNEQSLAPQEVYKVKKGGNANEIKLQNGIAAARDELTREDKQRLRRATKRRRAKGGANPQGPERKKNKKDAAVSILSNAKNITVINKRGEKHDVRGNIKDSKSREDVDKIKL